MSTKEKPFKTEIDLCSRFVEGVDQKVWVVLAETSGWDMLLSRREDGFQIGIQAKLKLNAKVLAQALEEWASSACSPGPDYRAVLVPADATMTLGPLAAYIGIAVIRVYNPGRRWMNETFSPQLPKSPSDHGWGNRHWHEWRPAQRHKLPEYVPDVVAGAPAPTQLTDWKIKAIKIALTLATRGYVTRADFKYHHIDHRRWIERGSGWLVPGDGRYTAGPHLPDFRSQHPKVWEQISADAEKWMPKIPI